jgi:hypothetical protein
MKTITEFAAPTLKNASKVRDELVAAGKTPEELPAALGEALKVEGDKLTLLLQALELVADRKNDLKRVIVGALNEGEKAPSGAQEKDGKQFIIELYPPVGSQGGRPARGGRDEKGGRGDRKKGGRGGRGGDREGRGGGGRGGEKRERAPRSDAPQAAGRPSGGGVIRPKTPGAGPVVSSKPAEAQAQTAEAPASAPATDSGQSS